MCKERNEEYHINSLFTSGELWKGQGDKLVSQATPFAERVWLARLGDKLHYTESALY